MKTKHTIAQRIEQCTQTPDGLQAAGSDTHFAFFFFVHVCRTVFYGIGIGAISDGISAHHNVQGEDEVVQQCVGRHLLVQFATDGKQLSGCPYGRGGSPVA